MRTHIITLLGLAFTFTLNAQTPETKWPVYRHFATQSRLQYLKSSVRGVREAMDNIEGFTAKFGQTGVMDTVSVALVFHLMPLPDGEAITAADVQAQIDRLNIDFYTPDHPYLSGEYRQSGSSDSEGYAYRHEADRREGFAQVAGLPMIRFCLAVIDENGRPAGGLLQPPATPRAWGVSDSVCRAKYGGSEAWATAYFCNIWVARLAGNNAGFAQLPGGPDESDGIVIDDRFFARTRTDKDNPYYLGRTLSHLMGSYLNLYELWNEYRPCADDMVEDTPIHNADNTGLPDYGYRHVSLCDGNPVEMITNLMDNSTDTLQCLFTHGQVRRMQATLATGGPRGQLRLTPVSCHDENTAGLRDETDLKSGENIRDLSLRVFPNPATGRFTIELLSNREDAGEVNISNLLGELKYRQSLQILNGTIRLDIDATDWGVGVFSVSVISGDKHLTQRIFVGK